MEFSVKQDVYNKKVYRLVGELPRRVQAIIQAVPADVAERVLEDVVRGAPDDIAGYPKMLHLARVELPGVDSAVAIVAPGYAYSYKLRQSDASTTVLYVKPREFKNRELDPGAVILSNYNPWTMSTLPYEPHRMEASMVSRRVSEREVAAIEKKRKADRTKVDKELKEAGKAVARVHPRLLQRRVSRDLGFEVLRREFGINTRAVAHWRPAVRSARSRYVTAVLKRLVRWLAVPSEYRWRRRVFLRKEKASTVKKIQGFQRALGA